MTSEVIQMLSEGTQLSDPHRCLAGPGCRETTLIDGHRTPAMTIDPDTLCEACLRHIEDACRQLPRDWAQLSASLGDRQSETVKVSSTPTPAIPISTGAESIMAAIIEIADLAAAMVSDQLNTDPPADRRKSLPAILIDGKKRPPLRGSIAAHHTNQAKPAPLDALTAAVRLVQPNIDVLVRVEKQDAMVWRQARRCPTHTDAIESAETALDDAATPVDQAHAALAINHARHEAANCDDCNGYYRHGQARELTQISGIDVALQISNIHNTTRAYLGHTRLRHHYDMPCPAYDKHGNYCGAPTVGRDDGSDWVNCQTCGAQWTEREYDWLKTMVAEDEEINMLRYLLAEAYWRLDTLAAGAEAIRNDPRIDQPGSGRFVLEGIDIILNAGEGHQPPDNRKTTPDKKKKARR